MATFNGIAKPSKEQSVGSSKSNVNVMVFGYGTTKEKDIYLGKGAAV